MSPAPRVARNLVWLVLGDSSARLGIFVYALLSARVLGPDGFGVFALAQGSALYVWIAVDLGVNLYGAREVARSGQAWHDVAGELLGLRLISSLAVGAVFVAVSWLVAPDQARVAVTASALYLMVNGVNLDWAAKGLERFDLTALANAASSLAALAGFVFAVRLAPTPTTAVLVWASAYLAGTTVLHAGLGRWAGWVRPRFELSAWRRHLRASLLFALSGALLSAIQFAPVLGLTIAGGFYDLGQFAAAARIVTLLMSAGFLLPLAVFPGASRTAAAGASLSPLARRLRWTMFSVGTVVMLGTASFSGPIVELLYGSQFRDADSYLRTLTPLIPLVYLRYSVGSLLLASGLQLRHSLASMAGLLGTAAALFALVPAVGGRGACIAWIFGEGLVAILMMVGWEIHARGTS